MKRPEINEFGINRADIDAIRRYDGIISKRKDSKEFFINSPLGFFIYHIVIGLLFFIFALTSGAKIKQAIIFGLIPCFWRFGRTLFLLFWHRIPPIYYDKQKALKAFEEKEEEFAKYFKEKKRLEEEENAKAKAEAREIATRAAQIAEKEKRKARQYLEFWQELDGITFEHELATLLRDTGYRDVSLTSLSGDDGIDLWAIDPDDNPCIFQCKAYQNTVSPSQVRELLGSLKAVEDRANYAVMVALSGVTDGAERFAKKNSIIIWDGNHLLELALNYNK